MLKFIIHNGEYEDSIIIEGDTIEELQANAKRETERRSWKDCWSEKVED